MEDDRASFRALQSILLRRGCEVEVATTVSEGLDRLGPGIDWIVLDLMLPDGEGEDILRALAGRQLRLNVVVTTGVNDPSRIQGLQAFQPALILRKPIDLPVLLQALGV